MLIQLSAGTGPVECSIAVAMIYRALVRDYGGSTMEADIKKGGSDEFPILQTSQEKRPVDKGLEAYRSILFETSPNKLSICNGSICWRCESPIRKGYPRKNWYVDVSIIPEVKDIPLDSEDLEVSFFHCGGKGGQNVNKVESGVRLRYIWRNPVTGESEEILIECTETRDQPKNKERALSRLRTFIYDKEHQKYIDDIASRRKTLVSTGDRSAKIRTYNYPQGRITDHRINYTIYNLPAFVGGDIQECIDRLIIAENAEKLKFSEL